jgi:hypothetical protein
VATTTSRLSCFRSPAHLNLLDRVRRYCRDQHT